MKSECKKSCPLFKQCPFASKGKCELQNAWAQTMQERIKDMSITLEQAKALKYGQTIEHDTLKNPNRTRVPMKRGLYETGYLVNGTWEGGRNFELQISEVNV